MLLEASNPVPWVFPLTHHNPPPLALSIKLAVLKFGKVPSELPVSQEVPIVLEKRLSVPSLNFHEHPLVIWGELLSLPVPLTQLSAKGYTSICWIPANSLCSVWYNFKLAVITFLLGAILLITSPHSLVLNCNRILLG